MLHIGKISALATVLFATTLLTPKVHAKTSEQSIGFGGAISLAEWAQKNVPSEQAKCVIDVYTNVLGIRSYRSQKEVATDNKGLKTYMQSKIDQNPCFAAHAANLHARLSLKQGISSGGLNLEYGKAGLKQYSPGLVWREALAESGGNPQAAIEMLEVCKASQARPTIKTTGAKAIEDANSELTARKANHGFYQRIIEDAKIPGHNQKDLSMIQQSDRDAIFRIHELENILKSPNPVLIRDVSCGSGATTVAKGLGPEVDISDILKRKISASYGKSLTEIGDKQYHIYNAAFMGCQLAKCGVSPKIAAALEEKAAWGYRSITQCAQSKQILKTLDDLEKTLGIPEKNMTAQTLVSKDTREKMCGKNKPPGQSEFCDAMAAADSAPSLQLKNNFLESVITVMDSAVLYRDWYLGGPSKLSGDMPCTDIRILGPRSLVATGSDHGNYNACFMTGISKDRCDKALLKLSEWDVDFEWTEAQHKIGASFGASKCSEHLDTKVDSEKSLCSLPLVKNASGPSSTAIPGSTGVR